MKIHEYQAKDILRQYGVTTPKGVACFSVDEAIAAAENIGGEVAYFDNESGSWERTYGWAWLLQLATELTQWDDPLGKKWAIEAVTAGLHATVVEHDQWQAAVEAYLACVTYVDHEVGRLLEALDRTELADNTLIQLVGRDDRHATQGTKRLLRPVVAGQQKNR